MPFSGACKSCLQRTRPRKLFCDLSLAAQQELMEIRIQTTYSRGVTLFSEGQQSGGVYVVCRGKLKITAVSRQGRRLILRIARAGDVVGLTAALTSGMHESSAITMDNCELAFLPRDRFRAWLSRHADAAWNAALLLSDDCVSAYSKIRSLALTESTGEKLALFLLRADGSDHPEEDGKKLLLDMTHEEIGEAIGSTRETVTRLLTRFKSMGLIEIKGVNLRILDRLRLQAMTQHAGAA